MAGRLTLTRANDDKSLLSNGEAGYEWVSKDDPRVREIRLLAEVDRVGDVTGDPSDNLLIRGDSVDALRTLVQPSEETLKPGWLRSMSRNCSENGATCSLPRAN